MHQPPRDSPSTQALHPTEVAALVRIGSAFVLICLVVVATLLIVHPPLTTRLETGTPLESRLDINAATAAELSALPNIGPTLAARIAEDRETRGNFSSVDDLDRVPGIGPRTIDSLRPHATAR